jgi:hypothetical protein
MQQARVLATCALTVLTTLAGCAGRELVPNTPVPAAPAPVDAGASIPAQPAPASAARSEPIASQEVHSDGATLRVDLTSLTRQGRLVTLTWDITMVQQNTDGDWYPGTRMSNNNVNGYDVSAVSLVDPVNAKRYLVARSGGEDDGTCVCAKTFSDPLKDGEAASYFATFTAPPAEVNRVDVELKSLGAFSGAPIS